jgi:hypothetical protein
MEVQTKPTVREKFFFLFFFFLFFLNELTEQLETFLCSLFLFTVVVLSGPYTLEDVKFWFTSGLLEIPSWISVDGSEWVTVETYFGGGATAVVVEEGGEEEGGEGAGEDVVYVLGDENEIHGPYTLAVRFFLCF